MKDLVGFGKVLAKYVTPREERIPSTIGRRSIWGRKSPSPGWNEQQISRVQSQFFVQEELLHSNHD